MTQSTSSTKRRLLASGLQACLGAALLAASPLAAWADTGAYPNQTIKVVIPFPPGGTLDTVGRTLAQRLSDQMGKPVIVENKPGGNATIGPATVARSTADGYTLLFNASTFLSGPMISTAVPYQIEKDFQPVALVAKAPLSVAINKNLPISDMKGLIQYAKANPGKMTFAVGSIASAGHLSTELLKQSAGLDYMIVPYKGTAPAFQDLIGGQIDAFIDPVLGSLQYHQGGLLKVDRNHLQDPHSRAARGADGRRDPSRFRVLQLVRPVGTRRHACRGDRPAQQGSQYRLAIRGADQVQRTGPHPGTTLGRRVQGFPEDRVRQGTQDRGRRQHQALNETCVRNSQPISHAKTINSINKMIELIKIAR